MATESIRYVVNDFEFTGLRYRGTPILGEMAAMYEATTPEINNFGYYSYHTLRVRLLSGLYDPI